MWIFTTSGFVSAVRDWDDHSLLLVRARDHASLKALAAASSSTILSTPTADYPYRVSLSNDAFAAWASQQAAVIDYPNFKSEVAVSRGAAFARILGKVWEILHGVEDPTARHRPAAIVDSEPVDAFPTTAVRPFIIKRIQRAYPSHGPVHPDSTAVIAFGNPNTARVATLGINPSYREFNNTGLLRLSDLGVPSPEKITDEQARRVAHACYAYFTTGNAYKWFTQMQNYAVGPVGASYADGSACHLDVIPWATKPVWSGLTAKEQADLLAADARFLTNQLAEHSFQALLVNGRQALKVFQELFIKLELAAEIPEGAKRKSRVYVGHLGTTRVAGWTLNVAHSRASNAARTELASFLRDWFGAEL